MATIILKLLDPPANKIEHSLTEKVVFTLLKTILFGFQRLVLIMMGERTRSPTGLSKWMRKQGVPNGKLLLMQSVSLSSTRLPTGT